MTYSDVVIRFRKETGLSLRDMAKAFGEGQMQGISHAAIGAWENGLYSPSPSWLFLLLAQTGPEDWRHKFALEMLRTVRPDFLDISTNASVMQEKDCGEADNE